MFGFSKKSRSVSTVDWAEVAHERRCAELGVEDIEFDMVATYSRDPAATEINQNRILFSNSTNEQKFHDPVMRWKVNGRWYYGAVPVKTKKVVLADGALHYWETHREDNDAMRPDFERMISESRIDSEKYLPVPCPDCNGKGYHDVPVSINDYIACSAEINMEDIRCNTCNCTGVIERD